MVTDNKYPNANQPWEYKDVYLVASTLPTVDNCRRLSTVLGRTEHAVQYLWCKIYFIKNSQLKFMIENKINESGKTYKGDLYTHILRVKHELKMNI